MPKMKTKSAAKKRFTLTGSGRVKCKQACMRHMQMNKPKSMKRKARGTAILTPADARTILCNFLPYSRVRTHARVRSNSAAANDA